MSTMNISLPNSLKAFVNRRIKAGDYGTSSEYLRELIRKDQARLELRELLLEGLRSPDLGAPTGEYWAAKRQSLAVSGKKRKQVARSR
jgi:antitoxin ParD1/3/4